MNDADEKDGTIPATGKRTWLLELAGLAIGTLGTLVLGAISVALMRATSWEKWWAGPAGLLFGMSALGTLTKTVLPSDRVGKVERERDVARALVTAETSSGLQEKTIELHVERLQREIRALRRRALVAFLPGVLLCCAAISGPAVSLVLARQAGDWRYMLGGSFVAAVLLGAGSVLLRHDNKIREQIESSKGEFLYFSRLRTALDIALALGQEDQGNAQKAEYRKALGVIVAHLLAAPPVLSGPARSVDVPATAVSPDEASGLAERASSVAVALLEHGSKK